MRLPSRNARQRKPSHLGSYCHWAPVGNSSTSCASIGSIGGLSARLIFASTASDSSCCKMVDHSQAAAGLLPGGGLHESRDDYSCSASWAASGLISLIAS